MKRIAEIFSKMFDKRSSTNTFSSLASFSDFVKGSSTTGMSVTEMNALQNATVFACVRILSESIASLPLHIYKRLPEGGKERATDHPLYSILHSIPNEEMTAFTLWETLMGHVLLWGNAYAEIERNKAGRVVALYPLLPSITHMKRDKQTKQIYYRTVNPQTSEPIILPASKVLHISGLGFDGRRGYSVIGLARESIGLAMATEEYGSRFFGNGAKPGGVLEHPGQLSQPAVDKLRDSWNEMHQGLDKQHRVAILEEGMTYKQIGIPPEDAQFLQTRKYQKHEIAALYRVPMHMLQVLEDATFSNVEHMGIEFVTHTLRPWLVRFEQAIFMKLLTPTERKSYFVEFLVDGLLRGDIKTRYEAYQVGRQNGWLSANDIRGLENMNPIEGGDVYLANAALMTVTQLGKSREGADDGTEGI
ncbi:phage portal protein [Thermoactinomyces sp. DSM 45892]|uniref:phage portal protein n=1 Tax=Thermoactinomyces sp. DSM 45892 TaxID=1882753 RepID=UPI00089730FD|nr:phage portal protein [Thermoactinomyces sp. DSM 45892]SDY69274.1 phage portal protein, HK97 family [Thermoactinomyces sp. DSM 45892]